VNAQADAENFLKNEKQFHLGALPTEQSHPATKCFSTTIAQDTTAGISLLQKVDRDIEAALPAILRSQPWGLLHAAIQKALVEKRKVCFSGCGATGRVSILLEASYRRFRHEHPEANLPDSVYSIMTGGDYALVRSVESFEDYETFGRRQVQELGITEGDVFVAVTEGGETSSVIGSAWQALENGARVFFACNNPLDVLADCVVRSRRIIEDPRITKLDLSTGPMAIAGSTRLQATTMEILVLGAALETAMAGFMGKRQHDAGEYIQQFSNLLNELAQPAQLRELATFVELEEAVYRRHGAVTYFANRALLDIFTDTTERAPTFMLPPFRKAGDVASFRSWAFVKTPLLDTARAWERVYQRKPRCLDWQSHDYRDMKAAQSIINSPPAVSAAELNRFTIGCEDDPSRYQSPDDLAFLVLVGDECAGSLDHGWAKCTCKFARAAGVAIGPASLPEGIAGNRLHIACSLPQSELSLWEHLALKLVFNTVSTATMGRMCRIAGNWMAYVETTNKKLIDRGSRLISELAGVSYETACRELFVTRKILTEWKLSDGEPPSPVAYTIERLKKAAGESAS
jgi:N-acetylmuramic acid 6-phosphate etherase